MYLGVCVPKGLLGLDSIAMHLEFLELNVLESCFAISMGK